LHAAGESSPGNLKPGTYAVALAAENEQQLRQTAELLEAAGEPVHRVVESHGRYAGQLMAIGVEPGPKSIRGRLLSSLPLTNHRRFQERLEWRLSHRHVRVQPSLFKTIWEAVKKWREF